MGISLSGLVALLVDKETLTCIIVKCSVMHTREICSTPVDGFVLFLKAFKRQCTAVLLPGSQHWIDVLFCTMNSDFKFQSSFLSGTKRCSLLKLSAGLDVNVKKGLNIFATIFYNSKN